MTKSELDWVGDCHDNPMYAAEYIVKLEAQVDYDGDTIKERDITIAGLKAENAKWKEAAQAAVDEWRNGIGTEYIQALAALVE